MRKQLPISIANAPMNGLMYAYPYALIDAYPQYNAWLHENYILPCAIKLFVNNDNVMCMHYLDACSFAEYNTAKPFMTINGFCAENLYNEDLIDWIKRCIEATEYVVVFVDEYYLPECGMGGKEHYLRIMCIVYILQQKRR